MEDIIKVSILGIISVILALVTAEKSPVFAMCTILVSGIFVIFVGLEILSEILSSLDTLMKQAGIESDVFEPILKVSIIAVITKITCDLCKDAGYSAVSSKIQFVSSVVSIATIFPLFLQIIAILRDII